MNKKDKALVDGFIRYLQGVYGNQTEDSPGSFASPNSLMMPVFMEDPADYETAAAAMEPQGFGPTVSGMMAEMEGAQDPFARALGQELGPPVGGPAVGPGLLSGLM